MKILHVSDTHGHFPPLRGDADVVVHSGDFAANSPWQGGRRLPILEQAYQERWLDNMMPQVKRWLGGRPLLFVGGNHDFHDPVPQMVAAGIDAQSIDRELVSFGGLNFFGFPFVRYFGGNWNFELSEKELEEAYAHYAGELLDNGGIDVLVSHSPMHGVLDRVDESNRAGSHALRALLQNCRHMPKALLVGHIHEAGGGQLRWSRGLQVSNAARTQQIVTVN